VTRQVEPQARQCLGAKALAIKETRKTFRSERFRLAEERSDHSVRRRSMPNAMRRIVRMTAKGGGANLVVICIIPCPQYPGEESPNPSGDSSA
jgi:hypothetical protein